MYLPSRIPEPNIVKRSFNGVDKDCILVEVNGEEYEVCEKISQGENYWANSKPGAYGAGLGNTDEDRYKTTRTGLLGQMAFGKLFNQPVDLTYRDGGDKYDNLILNLKWDIKCSMKNYGQGLIYQKNEWGKTIPINKHVYVFGYVDFEDRINKRIDIIFTGFALYLDVEKCQIKEGYKGKGHMNYVVQFESLRSITGLLNLKRKYMGV